MDAPAGPQGRLRNDRDGRRRDLVRQPARAGEVRQACPPRARQLPLPRSDDASARSGRRASAQALARGGDIPARGEAHGRRRPRGRAVGRDGDARGRHDHRRRHVRVELPARVSRGGDARARHDRRTPRRAGSPRRVHRKDAVVERADARRGAGRRLHGHLRPLGIPHRRAFLPRARRSEQGARTQAARARERDEARARGVRRAAREDPDRVSCRDGAARPRRIRRALRVVHGRRLQDHGGAGRLARAQPHAAAASRE